MPVDLNRFDLELLTEKIEALLPGQALITNDNLVIRRRHNTAGYDCGIGAGGYARLRANKPEEAARYLLRTSAESMNEKSLGGKTSFDDFDKAIESVRKGEALPSGPSPAAKALRKVAVNAGLHSYRLRAQKARDALAEGDVAAAIRELEAIVEHAGNNGRLKDVTRAKRALEAINENHDYVGSTPELSHHTITVRATDRGHYVYQNGSLVAGPLPRAEAESRKRFLERKAARAEGVAAIEKEEKELPSVLQEGAAA